MLNVKMSSKSNIRGCFVFYLTVVHIVHLYIIQVKV